MALLRDKVTSAPLFEGSPLEAALAAEKVGRSEVLFDDVGLEFDPDAVLAAHQAEVDSSTSILASDADAETKQYAQQRLDDAPVVDGSISDIEAALAEARAQIDG